MNPVRLSLLLTLSLVVLILSFQVKRTESFYAYAVKGIVKDVRLHPTRFIGGWFFKKAFILIKLKFKYHLLKKLILKKLLKKKLLLIGRRKRAVVFPEDAHEEEHEQSNSQQYHPNNEYVERYSTGGLSQSELDQLRRLPVSLQNEYGHEMEELESSASEPKEEEIQDYLYNASEFDSSSCIPKSICEIMARGNHTRNQFENQILDYYSTPGATIEKRPNNPSYVYDYAAHLGRTSREPSTCGHHFSSCSESSHLVNSFMNEVFTPELCDSKFSKLSSRFEL